jgi:hypothetical protein
MNIFQIYAIAAVIASIIILGFGLAFYIARSRPAKKKVEWEEQESSKQHEMA